jgi:tRNA (guanine37-N1)-methyltransferase
MWIGVVTLFPEMFAALEHSIPGRAQKQGLLSLSFWNPRDFAHDRHRTVDDRPYGGGPGMVMKVQPLQDAILAAKKAAGDGVKVIYLSPQGRRFEQAIAQQWMREKKIILVAGRYEGVDERVLQTIVDEEWSIGDFVVSGGELPAMCVIDAIVRLLPGALGAEESAVQDSFSSGLLDYPHYTRPEEIAGLRVPEVLLSGDHAAILRWRLKQALGRTRLRRPDLLEKYRLNAEEEVLLAEFIRDGEK